MTIVTVNARELLQHEKFTFKGNSPECRAVQIIKNLYRALRDQDGILASIAGKPLIVMEPNELGITTFPLLQISLEGVVIYQDRPLAEAVNAALQEENFYKKERDFCVIC